MKYFNRMFIGVITLFAGYIVGEIINFVTNIVGLKTVPTLIITLQLLAIVAYVLGCIFIEAPKLLKEGKKEKV